MISLRNTLNLLKPSCFNYAFKANTALSVLASRPASTTSSQNDLVAIKARQNKAETISRAMQFYLKKLSENENIRNEKIKEYELGKQHLARMMGLDADQMSDEDVRNAISYLLPSGIFDPKARPFMKHPNEYFPKTEMAAFETNGRPIHSMFYTRAPQFNQLIHDMTKKYLNLNKLEDAMNLVKFKTKFNLINKSRRDEGEDDDLFSQNQSTLNQNEMIGYVWFTKEDLSEKINSKVDDKMYEKFLIMIKKLANHPLAIREEEFIKQFKKKQAQTVNIQNITQPSIDENGRKFSQFSAKLRLARADVTLREGDGKIVIKAPEGVFDISYFETLTHREAILMPFKTVNRVNKFDVEITVNLGGMTLLAKTIRYAISKCLCSFVSLDEIEKLRLTGLLTHDLRLKERKKPGQEGARRRYTWLKR